MAHPNETLVREAFEAFGRGDMDTMQKQYSTEDIRFHVLGRGPLAGDSTARLRSWSGSAGSPRRPEARTVLRRCTMCSPMTNAPWRCTRLAPSATAGPTGTRPS